MRKILVPAALFAVLLATTACNTISGVGRDVTAAGRAVTGTAEDAKR